MWKQTSSSFSFILEKSLLVCHKRCTCCYHIRSLLHLVKDQIIKSAWSFFPYMCAPITLSDLPSLCTRKINRDLLLVCSIDLISFIDRRNVSLCIGLPETLLMPPSRKTLPSFSNQVESVESANAFPSSHRRQSEIAERQILFHEMP